MITVRVDVGKIMILRRSLRRDSTMEVLNRGMDTAVIDVNIQWRKREIRRFRGKRLSLIVTYTQVYNTLGVHLRYYQNM